ncbi:MAG: diguanylate cyclase [Rhodocyclales bacterium]|nr:diguanylate cyclase [Rhodocyclales bacterium]
MSSLQTRLTLLVVGVLIASLWALALLVDYHQRERLTSLLAGQQDATVRYIAEDIDNKIRFRIGGLAKITERFPLATLDDPAALDGFLADRRAIYNLFDLGLIVIKPDLSGAYGDHPALPGRRDAPFRLSPFKEVAETGEPAIGPPRMGRFSSRPVIVMAVPVKDADGRLRAIVAGVTTIDSSNFLDLITRPRENTQGDFLVVAPQHGIVIAGTQPQFLLQPLPARGRDAMLDRYIAGYEGSGIGNGADGDDELVSSRKIPLAGWLVLARLSAREAYAPVRELRAMVFGGSAVLSLLIGAIAAAYLRRSLRPLRKAARTFDDISQGRAPLHALPVTGHDEVTQLVESFNRLQERLSKESEALWESEARYRQFVDDSPLGVLIVQDGIIKFTNAALAALAGYSQEELLGKPFMPFLVDEDRQQAAEIHARRMRGEPVPASFEYRIVTRSGEVRHWRMATRTIDWNGPAAHSVVTDVTEIKRAEEKLERSAHFDALTGIPNRVLLADRLRQGLVQTSRSGRLMAICYLDLDGFKPINDTWGHEAGDRLLVQMAERLQFCLRGGDTVARLGGDEFVLLLLDLERIEECESALQRVLDAIAAPVVVGSQLVSVSASIGVSVYPFDSEDPDVLLRQADQAMYLAKESGRNRYRLFESKPRPHVAAANGTNGAGKALEQLSAPD